MAIRGVDGKGVYGIPYVVEGYGIIYNDAIMEKYFALPQKAVEIGSAEEIKDFETLKAVVEDMTRHKDELGIEGVFSSTSFARVSTSAIAGSSEAKSLSKTLCACAFFSFFSSSVRGVVVPSSFVLSAVLTLQ